MLSSKLRLQSLPRQLARTASSSASPQSTVPAARTSKPPSTTTTAASQAPNYPTIWSTNQRPRPTPADGPRFEQTIMELQPQPLSAMTLIAEEPVRMVSGRKAVCDGGASVRSFHFNHFCPDLRSLSISSSSPALAPRRTRKYILPHSTACLISSFFSFGATDERGRKGMLTMVLFSTHRQRSAGPPKDLYQSRTSLFINYSAFFHLSPRGSVLTYAPGEGFLHRTSRVQRRVGAYTWFPPSPRSPSDHTHSRIHLIPGFSPLFHRYW